MKRPKRSISLRTQMFALMAVLVLLQSLALGAALSISRVFLMLDAEAFRLLDNTTSARRQQYNTTVGTLVGNMAQAAGSLSAALQQDAADRNVSLDALYMDDAAYLSSAEIAIDPLMELLRDKYTSGAFLFYNGSNADKDRADHSAVYLRSTSPGNATASEGSYQLEVGPISVAQSRQIPTSVNWQLDVTEPHNSLFYTQPIRAALENPGAEYERYGYWSTPVDLLGDHQDVIAYTMPLLDEKGVPFAVLGVEISLPVFTQYYLPNTDLPYQNSFYAVAALDGDMLDLRWSIPSGPLAQAYLSQAESLPLRAVSGTNAFATRIEGLGDMYCSVQPLTMYSRNSIFYEDSWVMVGFVPQQVLHETSSGVRSILLSSILITTILAFVAIFLLTYFTTRKIAGLSRYVQSLSPHMEITFAQTGIREIDDLTAAVEMLNKAVVDTSKTTSKILELTLMPMGGFEVSRTNRYVVLTEYVYTLLGISSAKPITREAWEGIYGELIAHPSPYYENIYEYTDRHGDEKYLRILVAQTDTGEVGVIFDATQDIEEHRKLAHELDYDALTHLYSRMAFKREAHMRIQREPDAIGAMVFIDLDNLKYMNDTFGHDMGDRLIIRAGELFRQFEPLGGIISRISGDEFAIYLHGFATKDEAREVITGQLSKNRDYVLTTPDGDTQQIRYSAGIAFYPEDSDNVTDLLKLSDYAMYEAKHNRKGSTFEFNKQSYNKNVYLLENREAINRLLDDKLIRFAYQPIVDAHTGEIFAYEALMRPLLDNFRSPLEILSVAAAQSKLGQLERLVLTTAFQEIYDNRGVLGDIKVFVNSIPSQLMSPEDHLMLEREYADITGNIVVEITEEENNDPDRLKEKLDFLRHNGIKIAVDDFGSGYSNEIRILSMNPDIVKVDIELISGIDKNPDKQKLLSNIISFCHPKGIVLVAEGVERREELEQVIRQGIDYIQGYYTGRPDFEFTKIDEGIQAEIRRISAEVGGE